LGGRIADHLRHTTDHSVRLSTRRDARDRPAWSRAFDVVQGDLAGGSAGDLEPWLADIDVIVHLAALNAGECAADPLLAIDVNIGGTQRLVTAAVAAGVRRFVYMSTAHVYGAPLAGRLDETMPTRPRHPYARSHRAAEDITLGTEEIDGTVLRLSNAVGAPMSVDADCWMLVANDLCRMATTKGSLVLRGDGSDTRDFVPIADVATAVAHVLADPTAFANGLFNLGGGSATSTGQLADRIADLVAANGAPRPEIIRGAAASPRGARLDFCIDRIRATGFIPDHDLDSALSETLHFCREHFAGETA